MPVDLTDNETRALAKHVRHQFATVDHSMVRTFEGPSK
jgi:hypothetical protein